MYEWLNNFENMGVQDWIDMLKSQLSADDANAILPIERTRKLDFEWIPENRKEFELTIKKAPPAILEGLGFVRYEDLPEGPYRQNQENMNALLGADCQLFLFPAEWYSIIPDGYSVIDIFAKVGIFERGKTDQSVRSGCLSVGVAIKVVV